MSAQIRSWAFVVLVASAAAMLTVGCVPRPMGAVELCEDLIDNDNDLATDCADPDCAAHPACNVTPGMEICDNGIDDDGDSLTDCGDLLDCATASNCATEDCDDGLDNDGDGAVDCDDTDCTGALGCGAEVCDDGVDNDGDGLVDCIDTDCFQTCIAEVCDNGMDEDGDGLIDCADEECATTFSDCVTEICDNGVDDDFDALFDCLDDECFADPICIEVCTDGIDNNQDGDTDCLDIGDCGADPFCFEANCTDGIDNDNDGGTDCFDIDCVMDPTCTAPGIYELFTAFDLNGAMLVFTPNGGGFYTYMAMSNPGTLPEIAGGGTVNTQVLSLSDDSSIMVSFSLTIPFFGTNYNQFFVGSNGYITFNAGDSDLSESVTDFFDTLPRISMFWDDLNPPAGTVLFDEYLDRVVVTFTGVPEFSSTGSNTFQVVIDNAGVISIYWLSMTASDSLVGVGNANAFGLPTPPAVNFL